MKTTASQSDLDFRNAFEKGDISPSEFHHRDHLRLAYVYLCESDTLSAFSNFRGSIKCFLELNGVPPEKYHETVTFAWVQAARHFMELCRPVSSFDELIDADSRLLDVTVMLTHYRKGTLFSEAARHEFLSPDLQPIPQY